MPEACNILDSDRSCLSFVCRIQVPCSSVCGGIVRLEKLAQACGAEFGNKTMHVSPVPAVRYAVYKVMIHDTGI